MALIKTKNIHGNDFSFFYLESAEINRKKQTVKAVYSCYKDKAYFQSGGSAAAQYTMVIPFSEFSGAQLTGIKDAIETASKRSIQNEAQEETNWFNDAITDATV